MGRSIRMIEIVLFGRLRGFGIRWRRIRITNLKLVYQSLQPKYSLLKKISRSRSRRSRFSTIRITRLDREIQLCDLRLSKFTSVGVTSLDTSCTWVCTIASAVRMECLSPSPQLSTSTCIAGKGYSVSLFNLPTIVVVGICIVRGSLISILS